MKASTRLLLLSPTANYDQIVLSTRPSDLIGYWPLDETSGTVAYDHSPTAAHGAYAGTVTLNAVTFAGRPAPLFGGGRVSLAANLAAIDTAMGDHSTGTLLLWAKVSAAGVWTDGVSRGLAEFGADASNRAFISKASGNNAMLMSYRAGGTAKNSASGAFSPLVWFPIAVTWDKAADQVKFYSNGAQEGSTLTGLGAWTGNLASSFSAIGDFTSSGGANSWSGCLAQVGLWKSALSSALLAALAPAKLMAA